MVRLISLLASFALLYGAMLMAESYAHIAPLIAFVGGAVYGAHRAIAQESTP